MRTPLSPRSNAAPLAARFLMGVLVGALASFAGVCLPAWSSARAADEADPGYRLLLVVDVAPAGSSPTAQSLSVFAADEPEASPPTGPETSPVAWRHSGSISVATDGFAWLLADAPVRPPLYRVHALVADYRDETGQRWSAALVLDGAFRLWIGTTGRQASAPPRSSAARLRAGLALDPQDAQALYNAVARAGQGLAVSLPTEFRLEPFARRPHSRWSAPVGPRPALSEGSRALVAIVTSRPGTAEDAAAAGAFDVAAARREPARVQALLPRAAP